MEIMGNLKPPNPCRQVTPLAQPVGLRKQKSIRVDSETWATDRFLTLALLPLQLPVGYRNNCAHPTSRGPWSPRGGLLARPTSSVWVRPNNHRKYRPVTRERRRGNGFRRYYYKGGITGILICWKLENGKRIGAF